MSTNYKELFDQLLLLFEHEDDQGDFKISIEYDNYHDGVILWRGFEILGDCYEQGPDDETQEEAVKRQTITAIQRAHRKITVSENHPEPHEPS